VKTSLIIFGILSLVVIAVSWRTLFKIRSHGFYRFIGWECILWLFAHNYKYWFEYPFQLNQIFSWILLIISAYMVITGVLLMKKLGKASKRRNEDALYQFEQTTELIDVGIFKYIRHPLYSSLIFLTWGIYLKCPDLQLLFIALLSTLSLYITAIFDEKECIQYFGKKYIDYKKRSKMFIPFLI
jgi:protein-S-isoprenylcysteine O-methyltransferase Ste14